MALLVGELYALLILEKKAFLTGLKEAEAAAKVSSSSIGSTLAGVGKIAALGLGAMVIGLGAVGAASLGAAMDFQRAMANVQTLIGKGSKADARILELGDDVKRMSLITGKSLSDLTQGLYDVIGTFTDTADSAKWLELAAKAGAAGMSTTHDAILLLSAVTKAYGDESFQAARKASDLIFETANLGVTTFPQMAASMGKVLPVAAALKVSQEELFGAFAALTGVTGDTAEVTTQLRSIMTAFLKPNTNMAKAIKETGYASGTAMVKQLGLAGAMKLIGGTSVVADKGIAKVFGRVEALTAVLALSGAQADDWKWKTLAMGNAAGRTDRAFAIQQKTVSAMVDRISAAFGVLAVNIGDKLMPAWGELLSWVEKHMPEISAFVLSAVDVIMAGFKVLGDGVGWVVDKLSTAWSILGDFGMQGPVLGAVLAIIVAGFVALGVAAAGAAVGVIAATWPILAIIGLVALAIKGISMVMEYFGITTDDVLKAIGQAWENFQRGVGAVIDYIGGAVKDLALAFLSIAGTIVNIMSMIPGPTQDAANQMKAALDQMHRDVEAWGTTTAGAAQTAAVQIGKGMATGSEDWTNDILSRLQRTVDQTTIYDQYKQLGDGASQSFIDQLSNGLADGGSLTVDQLEELGISMDDALAAGIDVNQDTVANSSKKLVDIFGTSLLGVVNAAKTAGADAMGEMAQGIQAARAKPKDAFDSLVGMLKNAMTPVQEAARLAGELISKELAAGLKSKDPRILAQAEFTKKSIIDRLQQIATQSGPIGKEAMKLLAKGIKSKDKDIHDAAVEAQKKVMAPLLAVKARAGAAAAAAARNFGDQFRKNLPTSFSVAVKVSTYGYHDAAGKIGGYASGAWKINKNQLAFIHQGEMVVPAAAAQRIRESSTAPNRYHEMSVPGIAGAGAGGDHFHFDIQGLVKARDPFEIATQARRLADFGRLARKDQENVPW